MPKNPLPESKMPELPPRLLLGPGPSNAEPRVLRAMMSPVIGYLDPDFMLVLDEVSELLKVVFQTEESVTMALSGTGSAGMEAGINSLLEPGDTAILCVCGFFGERMADMATRIGANLVMLRSDWGKPFPAEMLEEELKEARTGEAGRHRSRGNLDGGAATPGRHIAAGAGARRPVHGGRRDLAGWHGGDGRRAGDGLLLRGDAEVHRVPRRDCRPAALSPKSHETIRAREQKPASWYLDLGLIANYWGEEHVYHHTAPVSMILGLREGLRMALEEGLEERYARHARNRGRPAGGAGGAWVWTSWSRRRTG